jgi:hypothetical protein
MRLADLRPLRNLLSNLLHVCTALLFILPSVDDNMKDPWLTRMLVETPRVGDAVDAGAGGVCKLLSFISAVRGSPSSACMFMLEELVVVSTL